MMTRSGKLDSKDDKSAETQTMLTEIQAQMTELKDELARVNTLRANAEKQNNILMAEICRLKEIQTPQKQNGASSSNGGGTKMNACIQTENLINIESRGKNVNYNLIDQDIRTDYGDIVTLDSAGEGGCQMTNQDELIKGIVNYLQTLQVTIPLPKFDGLKKNPIEFIKDLEKYFLRKNVSEDLKLIIVEEALVGRAKLWIDARSGPFINYQHFKDKFLEEFYSIEARMVAKSEWENRRFKGNDNSLQEYYISQLRDAKFCLSALKEFEINYLIVKQLPQRAREVLATIDYLDTSKILQALARLDVTRRDSGGADSSSSYQQGGSRNYHQDKSQSNQTRQANEKYENENSGNNNGQYFKSRNNEADKSRNWRQRSNPPTRAFNEHNRENRTQHNGGVENERHEDSTRSNVRVLQKSSMSEFAEELCWDVEPEGEIIRDDLECKIVSPRIRAQIGECEVAVLVDSGSEVTVISEQFYNDLKKNLKMVELPVSNLTVNVAVGSKATVVKRQVQIALKIGELNLESPFLVVPGLSTKLLVGIDWLMRFKCVIDVEKQQIKVGGVELPDNSVTFRMSREMKAACRIIQTSGRLWYSSETSKCRLGNCLQKLEESECDLGNASLESVARNKTPVEEKFVRRLSDRKSDVAVEFREYVSGLHNLDADQREKVLDLLLQYQEVFSAEPGCTNVYSHPIILTNEKTIVRKSYPVALSQRTAVSAEIQRMLSMGIIERSNSSFCNPLRVVTKKSGDVRLCLDARFLNTRIKSDNECPPRMEELLQKFEGAKFLSTTDLVMGYWQVPLEKNSRQYTAFLHDGHLYQFTRVPFGVKTAGSGFIRALNLALGQELSEVISCYIDDILIASRTFDEHIEHLARLFKKLQAGGFTLSLKKSLFFREEVPFLGFKLSAEGIKPDPERLSTIAEFPCPKDKRQLQAFLGVCGYYRRFSVRHADFICPFRDLLSNGTKWQWNETHSNAFKDLKNNFLRSVTLSHYIADKPFKLQTDASDMGISGILYQEDENGDIRIISLTSRVLSACEFRYTTSEKELLAIIHSLIKFRMYLVGRKFHIITDHQALTYLLSTPYHNARLMRWILYMQEYEFDINHCRGPDNLVADFFSRNFGHETADDNNNNFLLCRLVGNGLECRALGRSRKSELFPRNEFDAEFISELKNLGNSQRDDQGIRELMQKTGSRLNFEESHGVIYVMGERDDRWRVVVPRCLVNVVLRAVHERFGHAGGYKMQQYLGEFFYWRHIRRDIKNYTRTCDICQRTKYINYKMEGAYQFVKSNRPNEIIAVDFYGPLPVSIAGVSYIFVVQDLFSKFVTLYPIKRANTRTCLEKLKGNYFAKVGKPERVLSDHGTQFTSPLWRTSLEEEGISVRFSSIRHPQSNPVERTMRELGRFFRTFCADRHTSWARYVNMIQDCLNLMAHQSTGAVPYVLHYGEYPRDKLCELFPMLDREGTSHNVHIQMAQERLQKSFDSRLKAQGNVSKVKLNEDDLVLLRVPHLSDASHRVTHKFFHLYEGPYRIKKNINHNAYVLVDTESADIVKGTYNRLHLRKYYEPSCM